MTTLESTLAFNTLIKQRRKLGVQTPVSMHCPRCHGRMIMELEPDGCISCINCGHVEYLNQPLPLN
jgi:hypothetical protein